MDQEAYPSSLRYFSLLCSTIFNRLKPASTDDVPNGRGGGNVARGEGRLGQQDPAQGRQAHMGVAGSPDMGGDMVLVWGVIWWAFLPLTSILCCPKAFRIIQNL